MTREMKEVLCRFLWCGLLCTVAGCGEQRPALYPVAGTVVFKQDGSFARFGTIEFRSESDPPVIARGKIQKDGSFRLSSNGRTGTVGGEHTVVIIQVVGNPRQGRVVHKHGLEVAKKYSDYRTSDLKVDIQHENSKELVLTVDAN